MATGRVNVGAGGAGLNIFTQLSEPPTKEGVWLQTSEKYSKVVVDQAVYLANQWLGSGIIPFGFAGGVASVDLDIYLFGDTDGSQSYQRTKVYKYDTVNGTYTRISDMPQRLGLNTYYDSFSVVSIGTDIYISNEDAFYKYDTITDTYTDLGTTPIKFRETTVVANGKDIHFFGSAISSENEYNHYVYNTLTNVFTKLNDGPRSFARTSAVSIGTDIYILGLRRSYKMYKYDTLSDTYTALSDIPNAKFNKFSTAVGSDIYIFNGLDAFKYDSLSDTFEQLDSPPIGVCSRGGAIHIKDRIYTFDSCKNGHIFTLKSKQFNDNDLVLLRLSDFAGDYYTELVTPFVKLQGERQTRLTTGFNNAWLFKDGKLQEYPSFYGDGTKWIKFKN